MEDSLSSTFKNSLISIPTKILNYSGRLILSNNLDVKIVLPTKNGHARDYRGLAELMGFQYNDIKKFERYDDATMKILESWETHPDATLDKLIGFLEEMERYDVIKELKPLLERDIKIYSKNQEIPIQVDEVTSCPENTQTGSDMQIITSDDLKTGGCTYYDAYVSYADEDCGFVQQLAKHLESPEIGFKLFIRGRDMLAGCTELDTNVNLIKNRCRQMLIILSPNFIKSPACEFQASFAASLAIDERKRMLIPIVLAPCEIPSILKYTHNIDFTRPDIHDWVWGKLINSLLCRNNIPSSITRHASHNLAIAAESPNGNPLTAIPETEKFSCCSVDNSTTAIFPSTSAALSCEIELNDSTKGSSEIRAPTNWKSKLSSHFKSMPSNAIPTVSNSFSSGATSGFHSQSHNTLDNFESSVWLTR